MIKKKHWELKKNEVIPSFKCPTCDEGHLIPDNGTLSKINLAKANELYNYTADPSDITYTFSIISKCNNNECNEEMLISGTNQIWENGYLSTFDQETGEQLDIPDGTPNYSNNYKIEFTSLPINLIELPQGIDKAFEAEILKSFKLFWQDTNSCANKIRIAVEVLLTNKLKIIKRQKIKNKQKSTQTTPVYSYKTLTLGERIGKIKTETKYSKFKDLADNLKAIKWIGNDGSHSEQEISRNEIQNGYKILEHLLKKIYNSDKEIEALTKKINKRKK
ncbi:MAG: hypothetical protein COW44_02545 [Flavobacteriaceae bacterium CG17_big_fil_post_rev_8_21_14_2_50_33_15]|nr:MAG: hypothetical protein COW44_02545 [Flavobacteriaceae bacterium CG17_big_fil_post_rev_8_21_14_2_50_33_15]